MLSLLWVVQLPSYSHTGFPGRSECGGTLQSSAVLVGSCGTKWEQRIIVSVLKVQILSPWGVCSVFSLCDVPSVYSPFHGHVFPSSVLSMVFVIEKQLCVALCSLCAISFLWSSFPVLPCPHLFQGLNFSAKGYGKPSWEAFLELAVQTGLKGSFCGTKLC